MPCILFMTWFIYHVSVLVEDLVAAMYSELDLTFNCSGASSLSATLLAD